MVFKLSFKHAQNKLSEIDHNTGFGAIAHQLFSDPALNWKTSDEDELDGLLQ